MANERLPMRKIREVLRLKQVCSLSERQIAESCQVGHGAVGKYLKRAEQAGLSWCKAAEMTEAEVEAALFPEAHLCSGDMRPAPDCQYIYEELRSHKNLNLSLTQLWLEYREQHPDGYQYTQFCERYRRWRDKLDYCMRQEHRAGEKVFLDYCDGLSIVDPGTGELTSTQLFVAVWGASNYTYAEAVEQLRRCGANVVTRHSIARLVGGLLRDVTGPQDCPPGWAYPEDVIKATLFLAANDDRGRCRLVAQDGTMQEPGDVFTPGNALDWGPLWQANLLPGFQPVHEGYLKDAWLALNGATRDQVQLYLSNMGVHGFDAETDRRLIETAAQAIAIKRLTDDEHHKLAPVNQHDKLGYDLECKGHCNKVFEVKGMSQPRDKTLPESETRAAQQRQGDYVLVFVYGLPCKHGENGYKLVPNPATIAEAVAQARVRRDRWMRACAMSGKRVSRGSKVPAHVGHRPLRYGTNTEGQEAVTYEESWEAAGGPPCPSCGRPMLRVQNGVCPQCWRRRSELEQEEREAALQVLHSIGSLMSARSRARLRRIIRGQGL